MVEILYSSISNSAYSKSTFESDLDSLGKKKIAYYLIATKNGLKEIHLFGMLFEKLKSILFGRPNRCGQSQINNALDKFEMQICSKSWMDASIESKLVRIAEKAGVIDLTRGSFK